MSGVLYPAIIMSENGLKVKVNFGNEPFQFKIDNDPRIKAELAATKNMEMPGLEKPGSKDGERRKFKKSVTS